MRPIPIRALAALVALFTPLSPAPAQDAPEGTLELARDPVRIRSLGMTLNLPRGVKAETVRYADSVSTAIKLPDDLGLLLIKEQRTTNEGLDARGVVRAVRDRFVNENNYELVGEQPDLRVGLWDAHRVYLRSPMGPSGRAYRGVTVFAHKERSFLVFDLSLSGEEGRFDRARRLYETIVATMNLEEMSSESVQRSAALRATQAVLSRLTLEDYDAVMTGRSTDHWERLHTPAGTGDPMDDTEHGYRRIRSWSGYKGELTKKDRASFDEEDRELGYLIQIDAMILERDLRIDSRALFFMSLDASEETWTIRMALTRDDQRTVSTVTGARRGSDLMVTTTQGRNPPTVTRPEVPEEGYIPQFLTYHLGRIFAHKGLVGEFASYAYNSTSDTVALRWDSVARDTDEGVWRVTTKKTPEAPPSTALLDESARLVRVTLANGRVWEPIELETLIDLWKRKGLPLE